MNSFILITSNNDKTIEYQLNQILAMLSFDYKMCICFKGEGLKSLLNPCWKILEMYSDEPVYYFSESKPKSLIEVSSISLKRLNQKMNQAELVL